MSHKKILIILLLLPLFVSATAQIGVRLHKPPPNKLKIPNLWHIDLDNSSENTYTVYLHAEVREAKKGLVFRANSNDFSLPPGKKRITSENIKEVRDVFYLKEYEDYIRKTNEFPPGSYTICIYVVESKTKEEMGKDCIEQEVKRIGKVRLISPKDGEVVKEDYPLFVWAPPSGLPAGAEITYNLRIVEVLSGQTKEEAMRANPAWFEKKEIKETSFRYPASARKLEEGKIYARQVIAVSEAGQEVCRSKIWDFKYGKDRRPTLPQKGELVFGSPGWCFPPKTNVPIPALASVRKGKDADLIRPPTDTVEMTLFCRASGSKGGFAIGGFSPGRIPRPSDTDTDTIPTDTIGRRPDKIKITFFGSEDGEQEFAVGGVAKAILVTTDEIMVGDSIWRNSDTVEINLFCPAPGSKGGFAIGGFSPACWIPNDGFCPAIFYPGLDDKSTESIEGIVFSPAFAAPNGRHPGRDVWVATYGGPAIIYFPEGDSTEDVSEQAVELFVATKITKSGKQYTMNLVHISASLEELAAIPGRDIWVGTYGEASVISTTTWSGFPITLDTSHPKGAPAIVVEKVPIKFKVGKGLANVPLRSKRRCMYMGFATIPESISEEELQSR